MSQYEVILADPPWLYDQGSRGLQGTAEAKYELLDDAGLVALGAWVRSVSAKDSVLLLWTTWPKLDEGVRLLEAWGFRLKTGFPWVKTTKAREPRRGIGWWVQGCSEPLLVGTRGKASSGRTGQLGLLCGSRRQFYAPLGKHSEKPKGIHDYAEKHLGSPRLELFARRRRSGWTCYGLELGWLLTPNGPVAVEPAPSSLDPEAPVCADEDQSLLFGGKS